MIHPKRVSLKDSILERSELHSLTHWSGAATHEDSEQSNKMPGNALDSRYVNIYVTVKNLTRYWRLLSSKISLISPSSIFEGQSKQLATTASMKHHPLNQLLGRAKPSLSHGVRPWIIKKQLDDHMAAGWPRYPSITWSSREMVGTRSDPQCPA